MKRRKLKGHNQKKILINKDTIEGTFELADESSNENED